MTEEELLKRRWKKKVGICQMCGRMFYKSNYTKSKFCPDCLAKYKNKFQKFLSDDDFKVLYKIFLPHIKHCVFIFRQCDFISEYILHQAIVNLWLYWNRLARKKMSVNEIYVSTQKVVFRNVQNSYYTVMRHKELPASINNRVRAYELAEVKMVIERLDAPLSQDVNNPEPLVNFLADEKVSTDKLIDLKNLTKQIMTESVVDSDIRAAIVRAEMEDLYAREEITPKEKYDLINKEYDLNVRDNKHFTEKATKGTYKLYNLYAEDIKEVLGIAEDNFRLNLKSRLAKNYDKPAIYRCQICGKAYVSKGHQTVTCENPKCKREYKNRKDREKDAKLRIEELMLQTQTTSDIEKKQALCEKLFEKLKHLEAMKV